MDNGFSCLAKGGESRAAGRAKDKTQAFREPRAAYSIASGGKGEHGWSMDRGRVKPGQLPK